jgi:hypothetical protein
MAPGDDDDDDQSLGTSGEIRREEGKAAEVAKQLERERERLVEAQRDAERQRRDRGD